MFLAALTGSILLTIDHQSDFDRYTESPTAWTQWFMLGKYHRIQAYGDYFNPHTRWYPNAWEYQNAMALKVGEPTAAKFVNWVLRDAVGQRLYIGFNCGGGTCPRHAADVGNSGYRYWWLVEAAGNMADDPYRGVWVDDVNLEWRITDGNGEHRKPINPRTGRTMTLSEWREDLVVMLELLRAVLPQAEIVHNSIWYAAPGPHVDRQIRAADYINIERGFIDYGIVGGSGKFSFKAFLGFILRVHELGTHVILDTKKAHLSEREFQYAIATYLLITDGEDILGVDDRQRAAPDSWDSRLDIDLGKPLGGYVHAGDYTKRSEGLYIRFFEKGTVYVNAPGSPLRRVAGETLTPMSGRVVRH